MEDILQKIYIYIPYGRMNKFILNKKIQKITEAKNKKKNERKIFENC